MNGERNLNNEKEVVVLTESYCNGTLGDEDLARLEALLFNNESARSYFRRYLALDAALRDHGENSARHWSSLIGSVPTGGAASREQAKPSGTAIVSEVILGHAVSLPLGQAWHRGRRLQFAGLGIVAVLSAAVIFAVLLNNQREAASKPIGRLDDVTGDVRILGADGQARTIESNSPIGQGDTVRTRGSESSTGVIYPDGTRLTLVGNTSITFGDHRSKSLVVHQGTLAASVKPQAADKPLLLATPSAQVEVLGTRFQMEALENRTDLSVTEGRVRVVRIRDQESVDVSDGKYASVREQNKLLVKDIPSLPTTWEESFERGLPEGWDFGEWVTSGLPSGSRGAVKAKWGELDSSGANFSIRSNAPSLQGLFAVQHNSHIHFTFKTETRDWINIFIVTRTAGPDDARFSGNYLLENFPKSGSGQWETVSIPLSDFKRIHSGRETLMDVVPFKVMFVFDGPDRELVIDRVWVTPDGPGVIVSEKVSTPE